MKSPRERAAEGNAEGITVMEATTSGVLPGTEERERLKQMLADGDPTNGAIHVLR